MADQATGNSAAPATVTAPAAAPGSPAEFKVPSGYRLTPESEYESLSRTAQKGRDADRWFGTAKELGFEKPEDLGKWKDTFGAFRKRGLTPEQLSRVFSDQASEPESEHRAQQQFDPETFEKSIMSKMEFKSAEKDHQSAFSREQELIKDAVNDLVEEGASEFEKKRWSLTLRAALDDARDVYPEGHPLREKYVVQPLTKAHAERVVAAFKKEIEESQAASKASDITSKADKFKAATKKAPTVAGPGTGQGKPEAPKPGEWKPPSDNDIQEAYERLRASRSGRR